MPIAAWLAVLSAIGAVPVWMTSYFATRSQLEFVQCVSDNNEELLSLQVESLNAYANYIKHKAKLAQVGDNNSSDYVELDTKAKIEWNKLDAANKRADELKRRLKTGLCGRKKER